MLGRVCDAVGVESLWHDRRAGGCEWPGGSAYYLRGVHAAAKKYFLIKLAGARARTDTWSLRITKAPSCSLRECKSFVQYTSGMRGGSISRSDPDRRQLCRRCQISHRLRSCENSISRQADHVHVQSRLRDRCDMVLARGRPPGLFRRTPALCYWAGVTLGGAVKSVARRMEPPPRFDKGEIGVRIGKRSRERSEVARISRLVPIANHRNWGTTRAEQSR